MSFTTGTLAADRLIFFTLPFTAVLVRSLSNWLCGIVSNFSMAATSLAMFFRLFLFFLRHRYSLIRSGVRAFTSAPAEAVSFFISVRSASDSFSRRSFTVFFSSFFVAAEGAPLITSASTSEFFFHSPLLIYSLITGLRPSVLIPYFFRNSSFSSCVSFVTETRDVLCIETGFSLFSLPFTALLVRYFSSSLCGSCPSFS